MPWTNPNNAVPGNPPSATDYNNAMADLSFLLNGEALNNGYQASGTDYSLSIATTWTTVTDGTTPLQIIKTIASTRFLCMAFFSLDLTAACDVAFDWYSVSLALRSQNNNIGTLRVLVGTAFAPVLGQVCMGLFTGLTPGANTFDLQYYKNSGGVNMRRNGYPITLLGYEL